MHVLLALNVLSDGWICAGKISHTSTVTRPPLCVSSRSFEGLLFSLSLSLSFAARRTDDASNALSRGGFPFPFPFPRESLLSLPPLLPLAFGVVFPAFGRTSASPRGVAFRPRRRETKFRRWQRWAQRRHEPPPPVRVSRTRVRRVHGEDQEDQEEVHRCGANVWQLGTGGRVRKEPGVHVRELLLRCVVVIVVVVARRYSSFFLSLALFALFYPPPRMMVSLESLWDDALCVNAR